MTTLNWQCPTAVYGQNCPFQKCQNRQTANQAHPNCITDLPNFLCISWNQRVHACHETPKLTCDTILWWILRSFKIISSTIFAEDQGKALQLHLVFHRRSHSYSLHTCKLSRRRHGMKIDPCRRSEGNMSRLKIGKLGKGTMLSLKKKRNIFGSSGYFCFKTADFIKKSEAMQVCDSNS